MSQLYKERRAEEGPTIPTVQLVGDSISLDISDPKWTKDGWEMCFLADPSVSITFILS